MKMNSPLIFRVVSPGFTEDPVSPPVDLTTMIATQIELAMESGPAEAIRQLGRWKYLQFTGLLDILKQPIFYNDILEMHVENEMGSFTPAKCLVIWCEHNAGFEVKLLDKPSRHWSIGENVKRIGNLYDKEYALRRDLLNSEGKTSQNGTHNQRRKSA